MKNPVEIPNHQLFRKQIEQIHNNHKRIHERKNRLRNQLQLNRLSLNQVRLLILEERTEKPRAQERNLATQEELIGFLDINTATDINERRSSYSPTKSLLSSTGAAAVVVEVSLSRTDDL